MPARPAAPLAALLLALALVPLFATPGGTAGSRFSVAVLRRDGVMIPFATFDGNRWTNRWPAENSSDFPIGLADVPKNWWPNNEVAGEWTAWLLSGSTQRIKALAPAQVRIHCVRRVGLRTNYVAVEPPPPPDFQPYPKNGLAVTGDATIERIQLVQPSSAEAAAVIESVKASVTEAEVRSIRLWMRVWQHPADEKTRAKTPFTLEVLARTPGIDPRSPVYYFEGIKKYPGFLQFSEGDVLEKGKADKGEMCDYLTFAGGWFITGARQGELKATVGAELSNCNRTGLAYTLPLGAIRVAGRLFWIVQTSGWDFERYDVIEIKAKDVKGVLSVGGGGCG